MSGREGEAPGVVGTETPTTRRVFDWVDVAIVAAVSLLLRIPAYLTSGSLVFDDGVFGASVLAMRAGGLPYREVFSSQGPLFLPLAWLGDLLSLRTIDSPRTLAVLSGVVIAVAVYVAGRELSTRPRALLAAGLVVVSGSVLWTTAPLAADGPASAFAVVAVAVALGYHRAPSTTRAVVLGLLAGAAFSVKSLLVLPALVAVGLLVVSRRRRADIVAVPLVALALAFVVAVPWGLRRVLDQSFLYHTDVAGHRDPLHNLETIVRTLLARDLPLVFAGLVAVGAWLGWRLVSRGDAASHRPHAESWPARLGAGRVPIAVWGGLVAAVLLTENPLWRSHVAHLVPPLALLVATARLRWKTLAVAAAVALPFWAVSLAPVLWPGGRPASEARVTREIQALPRGAMVISDTPGLVWRAGRRTPDRFVDTSILRITSPRRNLRITEDDVVRDAASPRVCGVLRWSRVRFGSFRDLGSRLRAEGYARRFAVPGSAHTLWLKTHCRPQGPPPPAWPDGRGGRTSAAAGPARSPD